MHPQYWEESGGGCCGHQRHGSTENASQRACTKRTPAGEKAAKTSEELTVLLPLETGFAPPIFPVMLLKPPRMHICRH